MDVSDSATEHEESARAMALKNAMAAVKSDRLTPIGLCLNCDETVPVAHLFCDAPCRDDYQQWQAATKRGGRGA